MADGGLLAAAQPVDVDRDRPDVGLAQPAPGRHDAEARLGDGVCSESTSPPYSQIASVRFGAPRAVALAGVAVAGGAVVGKDRRPSAASAASCSWPEIDSTYCTTASISSGFRISPKAGIWLIARVGVGLVADAVGDGLWISSIVPPHSQSSSEQVRIAPAPARRPRAVALRAVVAEHRARPLRSRIAASSGSFWTVARSAATSSRLDRRVRRPERSISAAHCARCRVAEHRLASPG